MITYEQARPTVGGTPLPAPTTWNMSYEDLDSDKSLRDIKRGKLKRVRIRSNVLKISLGYTLNDLETISKVFDMIDPVSVMVEVLDIKTLKRKTFEMYCSKKKLQFISVGGGMYSKGFAIDLTEC